MAAVGIRHTAVRGVLPIIQPTGSLRAALREISDRTKLACWSGWVYLHAAMDGTPIEWPSGQARSLT